MTFVAIVPHSHSTKLNVLTNYTVVYKNMTLRVMGWWPGIAVMHCSTPSQVSTWMGDCLRAGKRPGM